MKGGKLIRLNTWSASGELRKKALPCAKCAGEIKLTVHHIVPAFFLRTKLLNLKVETRRKLVVSLCYSCHKKAEDIIQPLYFKPWTRYYNELKRLGAAKEYLVEFQKAYVKCYIKAFGTEARFIGFFQKKYEEFLKS